MGDSRKEWIVKATMRTAGPLVAIALAADEVTFAVPGNTPASGTFTKATFIDWITGVLGQAGGTFQEHVLDVFANDEHGILMLHHEFDRGGEHREYLTAHAVQLRDGSISSWEERPGSLAEFEAAWGMR
jgi:ketosteroid isomerase-like protein